MIGFALTAVEDDRRQFDGKWAPLHSAFIRKSYHPHRIITINTFAIIKWCRKKGVSFYSSVWYLPSPAASVLIETGPNGKIISPYNRFIFPRHRLLFIWYCEIILCFSSSALTWFTVVKKGRHVDCEADTLFCTSLLLVYSIIHCFIPYILSIDGMLHQ